MNSIATVAVISAWVTAAILALVCLPAALRNPDPEEGQGEGL